MGDIISGFATAVVDLVMGLLNMLPSSPVAGIMAEIDKVNILPFLNWFIPFEFCLDVLVIWTSCVNSYYLYIYGSSVMKKLNIF